MQYQALYDDPRLYDLLVPAGPCEAFYRGVAGRTGGPVLELACGTGRLSIPLAQDGHEVVGVDASACMLRRARAKAEAAGADVTFVECDMRALALGRRFPLIIVSCNSLGHLTSNEELTACLSQIVQHLAPGGLFAFDVANPNIPDPTRSRRPHDELRLDGAAVAVEELATYDPVQQIRSVEWRVNAEVPRAVAPLSLRLIFPQELPLLLQATGLELAARYGDFEGRPLVADSLNQVCIARAETSGGAPAHAR